MRWDIRAKSTDTNKDTFTPQQMVTDIQRYTNSFRLGKGTKKCNQESIRGRAGVG